MHIGFDAKRFFHNATGLGNYARSTIFGLGSAFPEHQYILFDAAGSGPYCTNTLQAPYHVQNACLPGRQLPTLWRTFAIPKVAKDHRLDIFHGLSHELPLLAFSKSTKTVVTMHDLIFLTHPHLFPRLDRTVYRLKYAASCRMADMVVAVSRKTAEDVQEFFGIPAERVHVAYQSCHAGFYTARPGAERDAVRRKYSLPGSYLLFVGSLIQRKGCQTIIKALQLLPDSPELLIVGTGPEQQPLQELATKHRVAVRFLGKVAQDDLPAIYQLSSAFVYPSTAEGFGIPILEALFSEVPVITSTGSCFSEPGGPSSIYVCPGDTEELAAAIDRVLKDETLRASMVYQGLRHAQQFRIEATSAALMRLYRTLCPTGSACP